MLADAMVVTTVAVTDLDRAKQFFAEQLGLPLLDEQSFAIRFGAGEGTQISVRRGQPNIGQTVGHFEVEDIETVVRDLLARGVPFQDYETPKTVDFIAQLGPARGAWFSIDALRAYALRAARAAAARRCPDMLLMLGDQIYADQPSPALERGARRARAPGRTRPTDELADFTEYALAYREAWSRPGDPLAAVDGPDDDGLRRPRDPRRVADLAGLAATR